MRFFVFEAGSRAGFSAEQFFLSYRKYAAENRDELMMVDLEKTFRDVALANNVHRVNEEEAFGIITKDDVVFPADELTRQKNDLIRYLANFNSYSIVSDWFYNKRIVNDILQERCVGKNIDINIPRTFSSEDVFVKPNTFSAGSKGCYKASNVCVSEFIDIKNEYVVDCLEKDGVYRIFPREVKLKNGYDKYIKLLPIDGLLAMQVLRFIEATKPFGIFSGIFHLQIVRDVNDNLYYIESSKRISGTSLVNIFRGYNPFAFIRGVESPISGRFKEGVWYRYEDFVKALAYV